MNELRWKNFDLNMLLSYSIGRHAVNNLVSGSIEGRSVTPLIFNPDKISFWENREIKLITRRLVENYPGIGGL